MQKSIDGPSHKGALYLSHLLPESLNQLWVTLKIAVVVFAAELAIMLSLFLGDEGALEAAIADAFLLTILISPIVWVWIISPYVEARDRTVDELCQAGRQNKLILEAAGEGIFGLDREGKTTFINPAAARMLGWRAEELIGRVNHDIAHHTRPDGSPYPKEECPIYMAFQDGSVHREDRALFWRKDGSSFPVEYVSTPILEDGELRGAVVTFKDITKRREHEAERNRMELQLRHAQKLESIGQLAAGIAHEINTPTQFVCDNTQFLRDCFGDLERLLKAQGRLLEGVEAGEVSPELIREVRTLSEEVDADYLTDEIPDAIEQSQEGLGRIAKIVRAMKRFSHPGTDEKSPIDINQAITDTLDVSRSEWKYCAEVATDFERPMRPVPCIPGEFNQVILNMVVNAAHAIAEKPEEEFDEMGTITISTRCTGEWAEIRISDTGGGIPEELRSRIFDPFFTTKEVGKGSGQGLAIAYSAVVDKHNGTIHVESEVGEGTTFTIRLPLTERSRHQELIHSAA